MLVCTGIYLFIYLLFTQVSLSSDIVYLLRLQSCRYMSKQLPLYLYLLCVSEVLWVQVLHRPYIYWRISKNPYSVTALCYYSCHSSACLKRDSTFFFESRKWTSNFKMILKKRSLDTTGWRPERHENIQKNLLNKWNGSGTVTGWVAEDVN